MHAIKGPKISTTENETETPSKMFLTQRGELLLLKTGTPPRRKSRIVSALGVVCRPDGWSLLYCRTHLFSFDWKDRAVRQSEASWVMAQDLWGCSFFLVMFLLPAGLSQFILRVTGTPIFLCVLLKFVKCAWSAGLVVFYRWTLKLHTNPSQHLFEYSAHHLWPLSY